MVTSNGERLIVKNNVRNGSLWSDIVFEKEVSVREFGFKTSDLEFEVSKSSIWKHTLCDTVFFSSIIIWQLWRPIELKFSQVCYSMHFLRYIKWEDWSWQLPIVSSVFRGNLVQLLHGKLYTSLNKVLFKDVGKVNSVQCTWAQNRQNACFGKNAQACVTVNHTESVSQRANIDHTDD